MAKKNKEKSTKNNVSTNEIISKFVDTLHLKNLPDSLRGNIACDLVLLVGLIIFIAEPVLAYLDSMLITVLNFVLRLCSKNLLTPKTVDAGLTNQWAIFAFIVAVFLCPITVSLLDGFKNKKSNSD